MGRPEHCNTITNYQEFRDEIQRFADGHYQCLLVIGGPGLGKSEAVKSTLKNYLSIEGGEPTPFQFYKDCYDHRGQPIVLDDVSPKFYKDYNTNSYLKILTNSKRVKTLGWHTAALDGTDYPTSFKTTSKVVILANDWDDASPHMKALGSRAQVIIFDPSPAEVHLEIARGGWFHDNEVYEYVWARRRLITRPDMRLYKKLQEQKNAGAPWKKRGLELLIGDARLQKVAELLQDKTLTSNKQRCDAFMKLGLGGRTLFYELLSEFRFYKIEDDENIVPPKLPPKPPESDDDAEDDELDEFYENQLLNKSDLEDEVN